MCWLAAQALADAHVNVNCVSQTLRQVNMQFVIEREDYKTAVKALEHGAVRQFRHTRASRLIPGFACPARLCAGFCGAQGVWVG